jgi:hypothetical protein|tara:strand:+ start:1400 stop:1786 length:387 start_codon:yes stop_codon:yes gene_type:complete
VITLKTRSFGDQIGQDIPNICPKPAFTQQKSSTNAQALTEIGLLNLFGHQNGVQLIGKTKKTERNNMDAQHHATIVDKLMQYRGKIPKNGHLGNKNAQVQAYMLRMNVEHLIKMIDAFAVADEKGLIR